MIYYCSLCGLVLRILLCYLFWSFCWFLVSKAWGIIYTGLDLYKIRVRPLFNPSSVGRVSHLTLTWSCRCYHHYHHHLHFHETTTTIIKHLQPQSDHHKTTTTPKPDHHNPSVNTTSTNPQPPLSRYGAPHCFTQKTNFMEDMETSIPCRRIPWRLSLE